MNLNKPAVTMIQRPARQGFALILSISLMGFILMLMLGLTALTQVEMATATTGQKLDLARENARLGLFIAIGELQQAAGPDQRLTARAEILGDTVTGGARFWTGVWTPDNATGYSSESPVRWMVSGNEAPTDTLNPVDATGSVTDDDYVVLVGSGSVQAPSLATYPQDCYVAVRKVAIDSGGYAYWVGDEGVKADFGLFEDDYQTVNLNNWKTENEQQVLAQQVGSFSTADLFEDRDFNRFDQMLESRIENAVTLNTALSLELPEVPTYRQVIKEHAHDLTASSHFVLTNTLDGGLRKDLSHLKRYSMTAPNLQLNLKADFNTSSAWDMVTPELVRFMRFHETAGNAITPDVPDNYMDAVVTFATTPLIPELGILCGIGCRTTKDSRNQTIITDDVYLVYYIVADLLNPYTKEMDLANGTGATLSDPKDIAIVVKNLPEVTIRNGRTRRKTRIQIPEIEGGINSFYSHEAGYMRGNFSPLSTDKNEILGHGVFAVKIGDLRYTPQLYDPYTIEFGTTDVQIELSEANTNKTTPRLFQTITLENWGGFEIEYEGTDSDSRFVHAGSGMDRSWLSSGNWTFGIHLKYLDDWVETMSARQPQYLDHLLTAFDIRKRRITIDMNNRGQGDGEYFSTTDPDEINRSNLMISNDFFQGAYSGTGTNNRLARLYDLPDHEPLSLSAYNLLISPNGMPRPLGNYFNNEASGNLIDRNSDGDFDDPDESLNNFYDRYYFSGLPNNVANWDQASPLPNPRLAKADPELDIASLGGADSATQFLLRAGININSQSVEAWRALLQGRPIKDFKYTDSNNRRQTIAKLERTVFNHTFSPDQNLSDGSNYRYISSSQNTRFSNGIIPDGTHESFIQGFRSLTANEAEAVAFNFVQKHREWTEAKGRPFASVTEFINTGILQQAIDDVKTINTPGNKRIPNLAPAHVNAGGILGQHSNALFARSDTFVIRAYGEVIDPHNDTVDASAVCEALVQRMPGESMDHDVRKFKIIGFRWLSDSDI